ncbi:type VII secretion-associated serine protease mycosin [compost metagenome]
MDTYIILRKPNQPDARAGDYTTRTFGLIRGVSTSPQLAVERVPTHAIAGLRRDPQVVALARSMPTKLIQPFVSSSSSKNDAWGIAAVNADTSPYTGDGVTVAVLDTGIDAKHPAFHGVSLTQKDFTGEGEMDTNGHGTHCAGTILGRDVNGLRIGVARGVKQALIGKVLGDNGGSSDMLFNALHWAMNSGANIISMSLGFDFPGMVSQRVQAGYPVEMATSDALESYRGNLRMLDTIMRMFSDRSAFGDSPIVIAAAGNESRRQVRGDFKIAASLPAAADNVISVAAAGKQGSDYGIAAFSNIHPKLSAPGVDVLSAWPGGTLKSLDGTSMACPHVAGVAALWWEQALKSKAASPSALTSAQLTATASTQGFSAEFDSTDYGFGLVTSPK